MIDGHRCQERPHRGGGFDDPKAGAVGQVATVALGTAVHVVAAAHGEGVRAAAVVTVDVDAARRAIGTQGAVGTLDVPQVVTWTRYGSL